MKGFFLVLSAYGRGGYSKEKYSCTRNPIRPARLGENSTRTREKTYKIRPDRGSLGRGGSGWSDRAGFAHPYAREIKMATGGGRIFFFCSPKKSPEVGGGVWVVGHLFSCLIS